MKPFKDWEKIFLDTGIILSLFNKRANPDVENETFELVEYLMQYLLNKSMELPTIKLIATTCTVAQKMAC